MYFVPLQESSPSVKTGWNPTKDSSNHTSTSSWTTRYDPAAINSYEKDSLAIELEPLDRTLEMIYNRLIRAETKDDVTLAAALLRQTLDSFDIKTEGDKPQ